MSVIKILTWNISWEAMKAQAETFGAKCAPNICHNNVRDKIVEINTTKGLDFILLQEAQIDYNDLQQKLGVNYNYIIYKNGRAGNEEFSIIFYNQTIWKVSKEIKWGFHAGRPFIIALFQKIGTKQNILITNLHGPHGGLNDRSTGKTLPNYLDFLDYYRLGGPSVDYTGRNISTNPRVDLTNLPIIVGGDFNLSIPGTIQIFNQIFSNEGNQKTCSDKEELKAQGLSFSYDHILINDKLTYGKVEYPKVDDKMYSDHIPIYAEINIRSVFIPPIVVSPPIAVPPRVVMKYGFDFDGVIHKSVTIPDLNGQRHPNSTVLIKNDQIFSKIEEYLTAGHSIEIISSRWDQSIIKPYLLQNSIICNSNETRITVNMKAKGDLKHEIVATSNCIEFYDDSVNVLTDIMIELRKKEITTMKLFLVRPEFNDFIQVVSIAQLRNELIKLNIKLLCNKSIENKINADYKKLKEHINILMADPTI